MYLYIILKNLHSVLANNLITLRVEKHWQDIVASDEIRSQFQIIYLFDWKFWKF